VIRVNLEQWGQTLDDLRLAALQAAHPRSRERFQALYLIASGQFNATTCAAHIGRNDETVLAWVHRYNQHGPDALAYRRSGGHAPLLPRNRPNGSWTASKKPTRRRRVCSATTGP
jgi:hypothetical protein